MKIEGLFKTALENLRAANRLLRRDRWIQRDFAQDCNGLSCKPRSIKAEAFCALGAVKSVDGPGERKAAEILRQAALMELLVLEPTRYSKASNSSIFRINDTYGDEAVKKMFRRAIRLAQK